VCSCLISYLPLSSLPNPPLFLSLSFFLFFYFLPHSLPRNSFIFSYTLSLSVLLPSFTCFSTILSFPCFFLTLHSPLSTFLVLTLQLLSLFPLSSHSRHNKQYVTTLNPALQDALSHLHAAPEIARSIKLNSSLVASSLLFYQFRHASRYISLCLFLLMLFLIIIIKMWECLWVEPYGNDHNNSAKH